LRISYSNGVVYANVCKTLLIMSHTKRKPVSKHVDIHAIPYTTHKQAIELSKLHKDLKPIKYLIK